jgi:hypothetical protein
VLTALVVIGAEMLAETRWKASVRDTDRSRRCPETPANQHLCLLSKRTAGLLSRGRPAVRPMFLSEEDEKTNSKR